MTRAQLKENGETHSAPTSSQPLQDVNGKDSVVIDELKTEITRLNGRLEEMEIAQKDVAKGNDTFKRLETRIIELESAQALMIQAIKKKETQAPAALPAETGNSFEQGKKYFSAGEFESAIESFSVYLKSIKPKHLEEATFLRGESFFGLKQYKKAIVDFSKFTEKLSTSKRVPAALFRIGNSFDAMGSKEDAKAFYQELIDKYPKAQEAKKARAKLR